MIFTKQTRRSTPKRDREKRRRMASTTTFAYDAMWKRVLLEACRAGSFGGVSFSFERVRQGAEEFLSPTITTTTIRNRWSMTSTRHGPRNPEAGGLRGRYVWYAGLRTVALELDRWNQAAANKLYWTGGPVQSAAGFAALQRAGELKVQVVVLGAIQNGDAVTRVC